MDLGLTRDVPFSYELYQQRVAEGTRTGRQATRSRLLRPPR